jgi:myo-inositol-1(or 4)-monophosphatase
VDVAIQAQILDEIHACFPDDGIVAEEGAARDALDHEFVWAVDPLDGTNNFALGIPCFAVSLGILRAGMPYAGVVHDPNTDFTCWATRGRGAFADDRALTLENRPLEPASNIAVRVPLDHRLEPVILDWLRRYKLRGFGSVALHLGYAAIGALDLVVDHKAMVWDVAAGAVILPEAGGVITGPGGEALFPATAGAYRGEPLPFLAGTPSAHAAALAGCRAVRHTAEV